MNRTSRPAVAVGALVLSAGLLLLAVPAAADTAGGTKAGIEYAERQATGSDHPPKRQIEQRERESAANSGTRQDVPSSGSTSGGAGGDASTWQLALAAALGAGLTGAVVIASRQVTQHRHTVAQ